MPFYVGSIEGEINLNEAPAHAALSALEKDAKRAGKTVESSMSDAAKAGANSYKGMLSDIKGQLGKSSALGQTLKLLAGGGAVAAANLAAREFNALTKEVVDLSDAFAEGKISSGELAEKLAGSIPILGQFWQAGRNIREIWTGEEAAVRKLIVAEDAQIAREAKLLDLLKQKSAESQRAKGILRELAEENKRVFATDAQKDQLDKAARDRAAFSKLKDEFPDIAKQVANGSVEKRIAALQDELKYQKQIAGPGGTQQQIYKYGSVENYSAKQKLNERDLEDAKKFKTGQDLIIQGMVLDETKTFVDGWTGAYDAVRKASQKWTDDDSKRVAAMRDEATRLTDSLRTPLEKFQAEQERLGRLRRLGFINDETLKRGLKDAYQGVSDQTSPNPTKVMAEEFLGGQSRVVTPADTAQLNKQDEQVGVLKQILEAITNPGSASRQTPLVVSMGSG